MILQLVHDAVAIFKQIDLHILYQVTSRLVTCLNCIYASVQVCGILVFTVCLSLISYTFKIFFLVPEMSVVSHFMLFSVPPLI